METSAQTMSERDYFLLALECQSDSERESLLSKLAATNSGMASRIRELLKADAILGDQDGTTMVALAESIDPMEEMGEGTLIAGRYCLKQKLGEGGMGEVWAAEQTKPVRRLVALKLLKDHVLSGRSNRFAQECQALALMDHPNIAKVLDAGVASNGKPFLAMELVKGTPLTTYCDLEGLGILDRIRLLIPVCRAVQHAHLKGIIHRDLKPSNILVGIYDGRPVPKVIDFGVAKAVGGQLLENAPFTMVGSIVGTLDYMSPEQAELDNVDIDTRADVYSLGVLLYELLVGSTPHSQKASPDLSLLDRLQALRDTDVEKPSTRISTSVESARIALHRGTKERDLPGLIQGELDWITLKCLAKKRNHRYQSAEEISQDLERYLAGLPVAAGPPNWSYRAAKFLARHRWPVGIASLGLVSLLTILGISISWAIHAAAGRNEAELSRVREHDLREKAETASEMASRKADDTQALLKFVNRDLIGQAYFGNQFVDQTSPNRDITLREAVDRAASRAGKAFANQPELEATLRHTLGSTYLNLGQSQKAKEQLELALQMRVRLLGPSHPETMATRQLLAMAFHDLGDQAHAEAEMREVVKLISPAESPEGKLQKIMATNALANVLVDRGKLKEAKNLLIGVVNGYKDLVGDQDPRIFSALDRIGEIYRKSEEDEMAASYHLAAHEGAVRALGSNHPLAISTGSNLALAWSQKGLTREAECLFSWAMEKAGEAWGTDHSKVAQIRINAVANLWKEGEWERATSTMEWSMNQLGSDPTRAGILREMSSNLLEMLFFEEKYTRAETLWQNLWKGLSNRNEGDSAGHWLLRERFIELRVRQGKWNEVEKSATDFLKQDRVFTTSPVLFVKVTGHKALALLESGQKRAAWSLIDGTRQKVLTRFGSLHPVTWYALTQAIALSERDKDWDKIETLAAEWPTSATSESDLSPSRSAQIAAWRGRVNLEKGLAGAAVSQLSVAVDAFQKVRNRDWQNARAQFDLGRAFLAVEGPSSAAARDRLIQGWEGMQKNTQVSFPEDRRIILTKAARILLDIKDLGDQEQRGKWARQLHSSRKADDRPTSGF